MHNVLANYTLPTLLSTLQPPQTKGVVKARDTPSTGSSSSGESSATSASGIGSTFLSLLATELQNQDPTAPVDSTEMVGEMISLNQLDQLISINQTLSGAATATTASGSVQPAANSALAAPAGATSPTAPVTAPNVLPFDPDTMMPVAGSAAAAQLNSGLNPASLGLSGTNNNATGGK